MSRDGTNSPVSTESVSDDLLLHLGNSFTVQRRFSSVTASPIEMSPTNFLHRDIFPIISVDFGLGDRNIQGDGGSLAMSTSSTTETVGNSVYNLLQAYNVHHSGTEEEVGSETQSDVRRSQPQLNSSSVSSHNRIADSPPTQINPDDVSSRRRVPPYRETSRDHDISQRVGGRDSTEAAVVQVMFFGVYITGVGEIFVA